MSILAVSGPGEFFRVDEPTEGAGWLVVCRVWLWLSCVAFVVAAAFVVKKKNRRVQI